MAEHREGIRRAITVFLLLISIVLSGSTCKLTNGPTQLPDSEQNGDSTTNNHESNDHEDDDESNSDQDQVSIIANHQSTDIYSIPLSWINHVKLNLRVLYFHTSHGSQITTGMTNLQFLYGDTYEFNAIGQGESLMYQEVSDDLGGQGDLDWYTTTRDYLDQTENDINIVVWSWCSGVSYNSEEGIDTYLDSMNQLETDYPNIIFIYMTGHLDGTGEHGNLNIRNNQIRDYCRANGKVLFDFADIESYDPDSNYFLDRNADDECNYEGGNWAQEWYEEHMDSDLSYGTSCVHSHIINCNLKGRAFWWLLARIAGWEG